MAKIAMVCLSLVLSASVASAREARRPGPRPPRPRREVGEQVREKIVDKRQEMQGKRIEHGIRKGYLTDSEVAKLDAEQKAIADLAAGFKADGRLGKDEMKQLRTELNEASLHIWAEKHDEEGNQMAVYRLGKNVFAKAELTALLQQDDLSGAQARQLAGDFRRTLQLRRTLATADLSAEERAKLQGEYNDLLNKYFEIREPAAAGG
jgi:hypothetical protein